MKLLSDRIFIVPFESDEKTASGLFIPEMAREKQQKGLVMAVGNGIKDEPMLVKVGDIVVYSKYSGSEISIDDEDYLVMRQGDIIGICTPKQ
jgi:chaperonin GroES